MQVARLPLLTRWFVLTEKTFFLLGESVSFNGRGGSSYGNQRHGSRFSFGRGKKQKKDQETVYVRDDPEPKVEPENIVWQDRPLPEGVQVFLSQPTTSQLTLKNGFYRVT